MDKKARSIGVEFISVFGLPPKEFVKLAAGLECSHIGIALEPSGENPHGYPSWSLRNDSSLRMDFMQALRDCNISLSIGEGFLAWPDQPISQMAGDLDIMAQLGVPAVNIASLDPDAPRAIANLSSFVEMARERGLRVTLEFLPGLPIASLTDACRVLNEIDDPHLSLLIDAMHVFRSGGSAAEIAALAPHHIGHIQLCDVPLHGGSMSYGDEARYERQAPGSGELPLPDLLRALPGDRVIGLEVPELTKARAGIGPHERLAACVEATRHMLDRIDGMD